MKTSLSREHRRTLEKTVAAARIDAEAGAEKALQALGVGLAAPPAHLRPEQRGLRLRLREHGRQLGDARRVDKTQATGHLLVEVAYEHWHQIDLAGDDGFLCSAARLVQTDAALAQSRYGSISMMRMACRKWTV